MIRVLSLFSGIGAFEKALQNVGIPYELAAFSEIDKFAVQSYCRLHDVLESKNLGDIRNIEDAELPSKINLVTYGFPCNDVSIAGRMQGFKTESGHLTRSGLFVEALRIIGYLRPEIAIAENVKGLLSSRFKSEFEFIMSSLSELGYCNYYQILNAKNFGVPQNRERVFIVSIRQDIDKGFNFPLPQPIDCCMADILEKEVPEKYYLSERLVKGFIAKNKRRNGKGFKFQITETESVSPCIVASYHKCGSSCCYIKGDLNYYSWEQINRVYDVSGLSPTITTMRGGSQNVKIYEED